MNNYSFSYIFNQWIVILSLTSIAKNYVLNVYTVKKDGKTFPLCLFGSTLPSFKTLSFPIQP